ncbi:AGAP001259-PA-like protein [Anopheles sinensis]|uniref:AGAP001259-PA-like protein n=1 Tax=Anopheles sinensis TaxID=74873 RepID=A0A084W0K7_ANOSI|nr:AGAP001259-PA-like protein [Anopheles sinensis]
MLIVGGLSSSSSGKAPFSDTDPKVKSLPSSNCKLLGGRFALVDSKRKINCKTRIYKCIKRILKRNSHGSGTSPDPKGTGTGSRQCRLPAFCTPNAADYREIQTMLAKQNRQLEYDVNLAKCVEKPAFIKKIALNLLQSAVAEDKEEDSHVLQREQGAALTGSIQSDLDRSREYQRLLGESWYHENLPRNLSLNLLTDKLPGSFLVRKSTTQPDCYALSLRVPPGSAGPRIAHYLIVRTASDGYKIKGFQKEFSSLRALIVHHSVMPEALPVPLAVPRPVNLVMKTKFDDDYETVFDLASAARDQHHPA